MPYKVFLKKNEERRLLAGHAWVYANEVARIEGKDKNGSLAAVYANDGRFIGRGYINHLSKILVRIFLRSEAEEEDAALEKRIRAAFALRETLFGAETDCYRCVFAEADDLPALIVDRYGDYLVAEFLSLGMDQRREKIADILEKVCAPKGICLRGDAPVRRKEGLPLENRALRGEIPERILVRENGLVMEVDVLHGQKTGVLPRPEGEPPRRAAVLPRGARFRLLLQQRRVLAERGGRRAGGDGGGHLAARPRERARERGAERVYEHPHGVRGRLRTPARPARGGRKVRVRHPRPARLLQERGGSAGRLPRL